MINFLMQFMPFVVANAAPSITESNFINNLIGWGAGIGGGIIALFLIVALVKDGIEFAKGQGSVSIWKILGKVVFLVLIIGLIFLAVNYKSLGDAASRVGNEALNIVNDEVNTFLP